MHWTQMVALFLSPILAAITRKWWRGKLEREASGPVLLKEKGGVWVPSRLSRKFALIDRILLWVCVLWFGSIAAILLYGALH